MALLKLAVITLVTFSLLLSCVQSKRGGYQKAYFPMFCSQNDMYRSSALINTGTAGLVLWDIQYRLRLFSLFSKFSLFDSLMLQVHIGTIKVS